jgi:endoglucanase
MLAAGMALALGQGTVAQEPAAGVTTEEWDAYKASFLSPEGRIVDTANGNISHSEGQGYGLLLAFLADDREGFDAIWAFTSSELLVRPDGVAAWKWDPAATPNITDDNNASDGDILIAYALALAGEGWDEPAFIDAARHLADAVGRTSTMRWRGRDILLPGAFGFRREDQDDGPVVNLSYWVFEAFPVLARIAPETDWEALALSGRRLVADARFGTTGLPSDWISLRAREPAPAASFPAEFGYNGIRIPLYLMRAGTREPALLAQFQAAFETGDAPSTLMVETGQPLDPLTEPGYRLIGAALACVLDSTPVDPTLLEFEPQSYFGSTLHLLGLSFLRQSAVQCL